MQVKVAVKSTSYNPVDSKVRSGGKPVALPKIPGGDIAGVIVEQNEGGKVSFEPLITKNSESLALLSPLQISDCSLRCSSKWMIQYLDCHRHFMVKTQMVRSESRGSHLRSRSILEYIPN